MPNFTLLWWGVKQICVRKKQYNIISRKTIGCLQLTWLKYSHGDTAVWTVIVSVVVGKNIYTMHSQRCLCSDVLPCHKSLFIWTFSGVSAFLVKLTLKVLNFWKFTSYCSLKPLWSGMGEVVPARISPTLHPPSPPTVHQLSQLAL